MIFLYLDRTTRLRCKQVSKQWLGLFMTRAVFSSDRHLFLTNCLIQMDRIPASTFMKSRFGYDRITIDNCALAYKKFVEVRMFWRHLGKSVQEISFFELNYRSLIIMKEMPKVRVIECRSRWCLKVNQLSKDVFQQIEILKFQETNLEILIHSLKFLKRFMPKLQEIHPGMITSIDGNILRQLPAIVKDMKIVFKSNQKLVMSDNDLQNASIDSLIYHTQDDFQLLNQVVRAGPNIREIKLWSTVVPTTPFQQITDLTFELKNAKAINSLKSIESIPNLKSLFMICKYDGCCFAHELVQPLKVENFKIFAQQCRCSACFSFINNSFPNLKNVHCDFRNCELKLLTFQAHIHNTMSMMETAGTQFISKDNFQLLLTTMQQRPHMETANLRYFCLVTPEDVAQMYRISPNLLGLKMSFDMNETTLDALIFSILPRYGSLVHLHLYTEENDKRVCRRQGLAAVEHIAKHGGLLKDLYLPYFKDLADEYVMEILFNSLEQLNKFRNVTRYEFMEYFYYKGYNLEDCFIGRLLDSY